MTPFDPTANTFVSLVPQIPTIDSLVGVAIARQVSPVQRRTTPSCPDANTDVGLAAQRPSKDTSVSPWRSTPQDEAEGPPNTTVTIEVAFRDPSVAEIWPEPFACAVITPAGLTLTFVVSVVCQRGDTPSTGSPAPSRAMNSSGTVAPTVRNRVDGTTSTVSTDPAGPAGPSSSLQAVVAASTAPRATRIAYQPRLESDRRADRTRDGDDIKVLEQAGAFRSIETSANTNERSARSEVQPRWSEKRC